MNKMSCRILLLYTFILISLHASAVDYYWIGGSGNWGDLTHWATASGNGTILHNKTPGSGDDVYIDANSLQGNADTIVINIQTAFCRSLSIKNLGGSLTIIFPSNRYLRVFGSIDIEDVQFIDINGFTNTGIISCESPVFGRTIKTSNIFIPFLEFNSVFGGWSLQDSLSAGYITTNAGSLTSYQNYIDCHSFIVNNGIINLDTSFLHCNYFDILGGSLSFQYAKLEVSQYVNISGVSAINTTSTSIYHTGYWMTDYAAPSHVFDTIYFLNNIIAFPIYVHWQFLLSPLFSAGSALSVKYLHFYDNSEWRGNWHADSLVVTPSKVYLLEPGASIYFDKIHAFGDCENWINIECRNQTGIATLTANDPNQSAYIRFRDLTISGSAWTVNPHIKIGTVTGISGNQYQGKKMYWVGGSGKWNNSAHWSLTDGGVPASCIPGPLDTLYFTDNSGTATTNVDFGDSVVQFHSLFTTNQSLLINFTGTDQPIQAMGSFVFTPNSNWNVAKNVALYGEDSTYVIECNGNSFQHLSLLGGGTWSVVDTFNATMLSIVNGHFDAFDKVLNLGSLEDDEDEWREIWPFFNPTSPNHYPILTVDLGEVNINTRVELRNNNFSLSADESRVNCKAGVYFYTINPNLQWNIVEWISTLNVARLEGNLKRIRQLILNSETESPAHLLMDTLTVIKGNTYKFGSSVKFLKINALGECNKRIIFRPHGSITNWDGLNQMNNVYYSLFENVSFTNGTLNAFNSFDLAGNSGINFITGIGRTLYWVGGNGNWDDSTHWSLSSGGLDGECIPTPADSVIFDDNSSASNMAVSIGTTAFARDLMMFNSAFVLTVNESNNITPSSHIEIYGHVQFSSALSYQYGRELILKPDTGNFIFKTGNSYAVYVTQEGLATYTLIDTLKLHRFHRYGGVFNGDSNHVDVDIFNNYGGDFINSHATMKFVYLYSQANFEYPYSDVIITEDANISGQVNSLSAKLLLTSLWPDFITSSTDTISKVIFINPLGKAQVSIVNSHLGYLQFNGWAYLNRSTSTDTCIMTNGNSYFFNPSYDHHVFKYWDVDGDFCNPILLRSQTQGVQAPVYSSDTVGGDFLEIRDLNFLGPSVFYSGLHSVDQGNNSGIIWNNRPGYIWGLGPDRLVLECDPNNPRGTLLTSTNFQDAVGFLWSDGSTGDSLLVNASGTYWCTADYITCQVTDTIEITVSVVILDVKDSTVYCTPRTINLTLLDTAVEDQYTFLWNTGATTNSISFSFFQDTTLWYTISDTLGIVCTDTINLYLLDYDYSPKDLNVLNCAHGSLEQLIYQYLQIPTPDSSLFDWSAFDSINHSYYNVLRFTFYFDECEVRDSINLRYDNPFPIIPNDSLLCEGSAVTFRVDKPIPAFSYLWSTGETTLTINRTINSNGQIYLVVTDDIGQTCSDTVNYKMGNPVQAIATPKFAQGIQPFGPIFIGSKIQADYSYWMFNEDTLNTGDTLSYMFIKSGNYDIYYYALNTNTRCFDVDTVRIEVTENAIAWIPNAFSPNGDGTNDIWEFTIGLHIKGPVHLQVFSRWGDMIFETRDRHVHWDGYYQGMRVQQDAYVYVLLYGSDVTPRMIHGTVVVID